MKTITAYRIQLEKLMEMLEPLDSVWLYATGSAVDNPLLVEVDIAIRHLREGRQCGKAALARFRALEALIEEERNM